MTSSPFRLFCALSLCTSALSLFAVGCGDDEGQTCEYGGKTYQDGETIPNDCADCVCMEGSVACPDIYCAPEECTQPWDGGPCDAAIPRFWHNSQTGQCEEVTYGGCEGNENNFATLDECQSTCLAVGSADSCTVGGVTYEDGESFPSEDGCNTCTCLNGGAACTKIACEVDRCELPFESGDCDALLEFFWHNPDTGECEAAVGCGGNQNKFITLEDCRAACVNTCTQGGQTYEDGESFPAEDSCNTCSCAEGTIQCTLIACETDAETSCQVGETVYAHGATNVPDAASCNTCTCDAGEVTQCTEINCPVECPAGEAIGQDCTSCGPTDACLVRRTGCLVECESQDDCVDGGGVCLDGLCRSVCG